MRAPVQVVIAAGGDLAAVLLALVEGLEAGLIRDVWLAGAVAGADREMAEAAGVDLGEPAPVPGWVMRVPCGVVPVAGWVLRVRAGIDAGTPFEVGGLLLQRGPERAEVQRQHHQGDGGDP